LGSQEVPRLFPKSPELIKATLFEARK